MWPVKPGESGANLVHEDRWPMYVPISVIITESDDSCHQTGVVIGMVMCSEEEVGPVVLGAPYTTLCRSQAAD